jgi:NitT/TauT family transport system substrate-binding protein
VRVGIIPIAAMAPLHLANDEGLYEEHGVDVEIIDIGFVDAIAVLESGEVDVILEIAGGGLRAIQAGAQIMAVYQNEIAHEAPPDTGAVMAANDSGITDLAGLRGATIAVNSLHSQEVVSAQVVLREAGVTPEEYEQIEVPFPNMPDALGQGQVDAAVIIDPYTTVALANDIGTVLSWMFVESVPSQPIGVFWAKSDFVAANTDALRAFAEATTEAQDILMADEDLARNLVAEYADLEPEIVSSMPLIAWDSETNLDTWSALIDMLVSENELEPGIVVEDHLAEYMLAP